MKNISYAITDQDKFSKHVESVDTKDLKPTDNGKVSGFGSIKLKTRETISIEFITEFDEFKEAYGFVLIKC